MRTTKDDCINYCYRKLENQMVREMSYFYVSTSEMLHARDTVFLECKVFCYKCGYTQQTFEIIWEKAIRKFQIAHGIPIK